MATPAGVGLFVDVSPCPGTLCDFIEELYGAGITGGCQTTPLPGQRRPAPADGGLLVEPFGAALLSATLIRNPLTRPAGVK